MFSLIPNIGITEKWDWTTDIIRTANGTESRLSLRRFPRIINSARFGPFPQQDRRKFFDTIQRNIIQPITVPLWQYSIPLTQTTTTGNARIYFPTAYVPIDDGGYLYLIQPSSGIVESFQVTTVETDGATLASNVSQDVNSSWVAVMAMQGIIKNGARLTTKQISTEFEASFESWREPPIQRKDTAASLTTFNSLPVLERTFLEDANEEFEHFRNILDFTTGNRTYYSREPYAIIKGGRSFIMDRILSTTDMDYWRLFFDTVRGAWKPFYLSTQLQDFTATLTQNASTITFDQTPAEIDEGVFSQIEILYGDGTKSWHTLSGAGPSTYNVSPNIPNDAKVASVQRISYLLRCRMTDSVTFNHGPLRSEIAFDIQITEQ